MIVYKDKLTGVEVASDSYLVKTDETGIFQEIRGKYVTRSDGEFDIGANASQEEQQEALEAGAKTGIDVVMNHKLVELDSEIIKPLKENIRNYMKKYVKNISKDIPEDELKEWQQKCQEAVKKLLKQIDDYTFYVGADQDGMEILEDGNGMIVFCRWEGGETPVFCYIKKGIIEEKF